VPLQKAKWFEREIPPGADDFGCRCGGFLKSRKRLGGLASGRARLWASGLYEAHRESYLN